MVKEHLAHERRMSGGLHLNTHARTRTRARTRRLLLNLQLGDTHYFILLYRKRDAEKTFHRRTSKVALFIQSAFFLSFFRKYYRVTTSAAATLIYLVLHEDLSVDFNAKSRTGRKVPVKNRRMHCMMASHLKQSDHHHSLTSAQTSAQTVAAACLRGSVHLIIVLELTKTKSSMSRTLCHFQPGQAPSVTLACYKPVRIIKIEHVSII